MPTDTGACTKPRRALRAWQLGESLVDYLLVIVLVIVGVAGIYSFFKQPLSEQGAAATAPNGHRSPDTKHAAAAPKDVSDGGSRHGQQNGRISP